MKKTYLFTMLFALFSLLSAAQTVPSHEPYVKFGSASIKWYEAYNRWNAGTPLYNGDNDAAENENFFISRVKPRERFTFTRTQVKESLNPNRKLLWWCPLGFGNWNAIPSYFFGSEVFSMWSYVDVYGNWTSPMLEASGAFLDVAHKNGVAAGVVSAIAFGARPTETDGGAGQTLATMYNNTSDKLLKYMRYYGVDGIGWNSEFSWGSLNMNKFRNLMGECYQNAASSGLPLFNNAWYSFTSNSGSYGDYSVLNSNCSDWFHYNNKTVSSVYFLNYNWGSSSLSTSQTTARSFPGRSSFDVYAGMDYEGRSSMPFTALQNYDISFGLWGSHVQNMIYQNRGENGSAPIPQQKTYQLICENSFTGSSYNPVNVPAITDKLSHTSKATNFHGFSSFITARSTLTCNDLAKDPFVTYFNLGNGNFFKIEGETTFDSEWYNIGMQDYMPTWRWWWTKNYMGKSSSDASKDLTAEFTWDDAWFGGSCLQISGKTESAYLQLFKTKYKTATSGDYITIRYKVLSGTGSLSWACSTEENPVSEVSATIKNNISETDGWQEIRTSIGSGRSSLKVHNATLALIGLKFTSTSPDFKILIGEMSLTRGNSPAPAAPVITKSRALARTYKGMDVKVIFKMDYTPSSVDVPVYNADVNTWYYKIYTQQEGNSQVMCTATTSWAAYVVGAPYDVEAGGRFRVGVSAVSLDGKSESAITWGEWFTVPEPTVQEGFSVDKPIIKANEKFTVSFNDPNHPAADWQIKSSKDDLLKYSGNVHDFTISLADEGIYDLYLTQNGKTEIYRGMIQISPDEVGAMPEIYTLTGNGMEDNISIKEGDEVDFRYTGRPNTDGVASRGVQLGGNGFGFKMNQLDLNQRSLFTVSFWLYLNNLTPALEGSTLLQIRDKDDFWPKCDWGYMWCDINADNQFHLCIQNGGDPYKPGFEFKTGTWYHLAYVFDFSAQRDIRAYVNGKYVGTKSAAAPPWRSGNYLLVGGKAANRSGLDAYIDEFQFYNKVLTEEEIQASMTHQSTIPPSLIGYWDFESDSNADHTLNSTGTNKSLLGGIYEIVATSETSSDFKPQSFAFGPGAPFIAGSIYQITTVPKWTYKGATMVESAGDGKEGHSKVIYPKDGVYSAALTLENGWGKSTKAINYITVTTGIEDITFEEMKAFPNPFEDEVYVRFANEGAYTVDIYDNAGRQISSRNASVDAGEMVNVKVNGSSGIYFIKISKEGTLFKAIKVIKR